MLRRAPLAFITKHLILSVNVESKTIESQRLDLDTQKMKTEKPYRNNHLYVG